MNPIDMCSWIDLKKPASIESHGSYNRKLQSSFLSAAISTFSSGVSEVCGEMRSEMRARVYELHNGIFHALRYDSLFVVHDHCGGTIRSPLLSIDFISLSKGTCAPL